MPSKARLAHPHRTGSLRLDLDSVLSWRGAGSIAVLFIFAFVAAYALWYTSSGRFPTFPRIQNDYIDLGQAFLRGQLSLLDQPDPRLADLGNPYEYTQRKDIPYHWDASYYNGKYYLYWGPVPALVSAALQVFGGTPPSASLLVVIPYIGLICIAVALLFHLAQTYGATARLTIWLFVLMGFFNLPMLFIIGQPRHYQASILYGQLFLLGGVLGIVLHTRSRSLIWLPISGLAWGLAFASRYNLVISIGVFLAFTSLWLWRDRAAGSFWGRLALLVGPLTLCLLGLGSYNLVRFGSPLETGLTYQLTIPEFRQISYSIAYVPSGLYIYLLYPLTGSPVFPFIQSAHFRPTFLPESLFIPPGREFDQISFGLLDTVPIMWLFAFAIPLLLTILAGRGVRSPQPDRGATPGFIFCMLAVGAMGQLAFLLVFFYVAERYIVDFYVPVVLCLAIIVWWAHAALQGRRLWQSALWVLVVVLTAWTAAIGYFSCFGVPVLVSIYYDPRMLANLAAFWNERSTVLRLLLRPR